MRPLITVLSIAASLTFAFDAKASASPKGWRSGWISLKNKEQCEKLVEAAKEIYFNALIANGSIENMNMFSDMAHANGLESYYWLSPVDPKGGEAKQYLQKLHPCDEAAYQEQKKWQQNLENGYQGGGEPLEGRTEYNWNPAPCTHNEAVMEATKSKIKEYLEACPNLTGIALDMFGYQNYRDCVCETSEKQYAAWLIAHPEIDRQKSRETFFFETLVGNQNELLAYARSIRDGVKTTVHVWPVYVPRPLYGNTLNLDYCAQTAAWFFTPHWKDDKIASYTKTIVNEANRYHQRQTGVPFVGIFVGGKGGSDKSVDRLIHEISVIFESSPSRSLSIFRFNDIADNPEYMKALRKLFEKYGVIMSKHP